MWLRTPVQFAANTFSLVSEQSFCSRIAVQPGGKAVKSLLPAARMINSLPNNSRGLLRARGIFNNRVPVSIRSLLSSAPPALCHRNVYGHCCQRVSRGMRAYAQSSSGPTSAVHVAEKGTANSNTRAGSPFPQPVYDDMLCTSSMEPFAGPVTVHVTPGGSLLLCCIQQRAVW